jgi:hypothetical protein
MTVANDSLGSIIHQRFISPALQQAGLNTSFKSQKKRDEAATRVAQQVASEIGNFLKTSEASEYDRHAITVDATAYVDTIRSSLQKHLLDLRIQRL